uniref:Putative S-adenosylmethionine-dependent methyltransferase RcsF n=1 Tax=Pseudomonas aeruginosa TaxID=287 RepID=RCSF2_PSEAI|nr:RecName: Full=Putative S-adenosylmethionine-dependent methyltransferase RcsF [Pseudomonas aeruginosa]AAC62539.1 regulator protein [Pseudomonas aeruginosa]
MSHSISPIGHVRSCFKEKFAIPRQPQLAPAATGVLELLPPFDTGDAVEGLEQVSHVWLIFLFHQALEDKPRLKVRPPRLGGNQSMGVFATRATHRPNGLGQSVVKLEKVEPGRLWLSGIDLLDGTPVIDIKPYVPYADIVPDAHNAIADAPPSSIAVHWSDEALRQAHEHGLRLCQPVRELVGNASPRTRARPTRSRRPSAAMACACGTSTCTGTTPPMARSACWTCNAPPTETSLSPQD